MSDDPRVLMTVLATWLVLAVPVAAFVAALGRSALREDEQQRRLPTPPSADVAGAAGGHDEDGVWLLPRRQPHPTS